MKEKILMVLHGVMGLLLMIGIATIDSDPMWPSATATIVGITWFILMNFLGEI